MVKELGALGALVWALWLGTKLVHDIVLRRNGDVPPRRPPDDDVER